MSARILIVEDDAAILTALIDLLQEDGYDTSTATDGQEALRIFDVEKPDLVLLDLMIPKLHGYEVCRRIRAHDPATPILMLTAKGQEVDRVVGLDAGADDYIVKPFGMHELLARIRAAIRRAQLRTGRPEQQPLSFGEVTVNPRTLQLSRANTVVDITPRELALLTEFVSHDGEVLSREELLEQIWGVRYEGTTRTLDQHIAKLRQKVEVDPAHPRHIRTVHGVGYRFVADPEAL